jgi:uncharacterized membrane protein
MKLPLAIMGAAGLTVGGYVHWCLYRHGYRSIPVIGTLFLLNVIASAVITIAVLVSRRLVTLLAGIGVAVGTLGAFVASRLPGGLFHFQERGFQPDPQSAVAVIAEAIAIAMLVAAILTRPPVTRHAQD